MSITKLRGCFSYAGPPVAILVGLVLIVGFLWQGRQGDRAVNQASEAAMGPPAFTLDGYNIYQGELRNAVDAQRQQLTMQKTQAGQLPELTPAESLGLYAQAAIGALEQAVAMVLAKKQGIEVSDEELSNWVLHAERDRIAGSQQTFDMIKQFQVSAAQRRIDAAKKKDANSAETKEATKALDEVTKMTFEENFKGQSGGLTPDQYVASLTETLPKRLGDPFFRRAAEAGAANAELNAKYAEKVDTSDGALKKTYDKFVYHQIGITEADADAKASEVLKKIRGGMDFMEAARQFTDLKDAKGNANLDEVTQPRFDLMSNADYAGLLMLKPGEVSEVATIGESAYIYKLAQVKPDVPKDFDKVKQERAKTLKQRVSQAEVAKATKAAMQAAKKNAAWKDPAWKLVTDYAQFQQDAALSKAEKIKILKDLLARSKDVATDSPDIPVLVRYTVINQLDVELPEGDEKKRLKADLLDSYLLVIDIAPSTDLRFQYAEELIRAGQGDKALEILLDNAQAAAPPGPQTAPIIARVERLLPRAANLATKGTDVVDQVQKEIAAWRTDEVESKKAAEEIERENKKQEEELRKKEAAEKAKAPEIKPPTATPPTPAPTPPSNPGG
ncbi:MAG: peptidyl-prolyl cis-trans isomerase [Armatimonadetes bacterium]|nr:peptidyl-prolyl cis-trans isomerase [Armatimonadota bacterium]